MPRIVDYYFSLLSPWAYIGHAPFMEIAQRHQVQINYKPVFLGEIFAQTGGLPLAQRHPARQKYRFMELKRWRQRRGMNFNLEPKFWPFDSRLADRFVIALIHNGHDPDVFLRKAFAAIWEKERNLAEASEITSIAAACGFDGDALLEIAERDSIEVIYLLNQENAVEAGVFGTPAYVIDDEIFWGQDRLDFVDEKLAAG